MLNRTKELVEILQSQRDQTLATLEQIPAELRTHKLGPEKWSCAEVLDHLALVGRNISQVIDSQVAAHRRRNGEVAVPDDSPLPMLLSPQQADAYTDRSVRRTASEQVSPRPGVSYTAAREAYEQTYSELLNAAASSDGIDLGAIMFSHSALGDMTLYQWLGFVIGHEARHRLQIEEIRQSLESL